MRATVKSIFFILSLCTVATVLPSERKSSENKPALGQQQNLRNAILYLLDLNYRDHLVEQQALLWWQGRDNRNVVILRALQQNLVSRGMFINKLWRHLQLQAMIDMVEAKNQQKRALAQPSTSCQKISSDERKSVS